jgi:hypothetical protein
LIHNPKRFGDMAHVGGACSLAAGVIFLVSGVAFFASQVGRFDWNSVASISGYLQSHPAAGWSWTVVNGGAAVAAFLAIAGVLGLADRLRAAGPGLVRWTSTLAVVGYAILAVTNIADLYQIRRLAASYPSLDASARAAVEAIGSGTLDPMLNLRFMALGPWFLVAGWVALRTRDLPRALAYLGIIAGCGALLAAVTSFLDLPGIPLGLAVGAVAVVIHPVWLIGVGLALRRENR